MYICGRSQVSRPSPPSPMVWSQILQREASGQAAASGSKRQQAAANGSKSQQMAANGSKQQQITANSST